MACDKPFCNHMLLKSADVGFSDLLHILFSKHLERRRFCHSSEQTEHDLDEFCHSSEQTEHDLDEGRWLIFLSILVQKLLRFVAAPMAAIGWVIEMCLNIFSSKQNMVGLLQNFLRGKGMPGKSSRTFVSFIGHLDKRVELDRNIKFTDGNYNAALCMMASKISYENKFYIETTVQDHWKMEFLGSYDFWNDYQRKATTQAFMLRDRSDDHDTIVVAFRGTEPFDADAWCSDFDISWYQLEEVGRIHGGFMKALGLQNNIVGWPKPEEFKQDNSHPALAYYGIRDILKKHLLENDKARYIITGHSLGGALAILFPAVLTFHNGKDSDMLLKRLEGVYTFGQPRVGDKDFGRYMENKMIEHKIKYFRFVYGNDIVPRLPYDDKALMFKHFGTCLYYNRQYEVQVLPEEPNKNYFSPTRAIPMMMNAFGELIRSFTIPYRLGPDYKEGPLLKMFRLMGLVMPGAAAHCPQDYVNATRLGSSHACLPLPPTHYL
ncbi:unnamed protein product [Prunus armeniaca]|uniref:Fungal lipase-type domain-containing protein n=1 Tax=Prunus armeniaca TaxID=36596 RepID=A0A6J5VES5_PRUAR|nr:hypothetical protein GBA52_023597 [Prunus armeniaca]CAB4287416.1 unnamed protein product [Prunus armeniaca]